MYSNTTTTVIKAAYSAKNTTIKKKKISHSFSSSIIDIPPHLVVTQLCMEMHNVT